MQVVKTIDLVIQVLILIFGVAEFILPYDSFSLFGGSYWIFNGYFLLGGWQVAGFLIHMLVDKNLFLRASRKAYGQTLFWIFIAGSLCGFSLLLEAGGIMMLYLFAMLVIGPVMAIWYMTICYRELKLMNEKALVHLK